MAGSGLRPYPHRPHHRTDLMMSDSSSNSNTFSGVVAAGLAAGAALPFVLTSTSGAAARTTGRALCAQAPPPQGQHTGGGRCGRVRARRRRWARGGSGGSRGRPVARHRVNPRRCGRTLAPVNALPPVRWPRSELRVSCILLCCTALCGRVRIGCGARCCLRQRCVAGVVAMGGGMCAAAGRAQAREGSSGPVTTAANAHLLQLHAQPWLTCWVGARWTVPWQVAACASLQERPGPFARGLRPCRCTAALRAPGRRPGARWWPVPKGACWVAPGPAARPHAPCTPAPAGCDTGALQLHAPCSQCAPSGAVCTHHRPVAPWCGRRARMQFPCMATSKGGGGSSTPQMPERHTVANQ